MDLQIEIDEVDDVQRLIEDGKSDEGDAFNQMR